MKLIIHSQTSRGKHWEWINNFNSQLLIKWVSHSLEIATRMDSTCGIFFLYRVFQIYTWAVVYDNGIFCGWSCQISYGIITKIGLWLTEFVETVLAKQIDIPCDIAKRAVFRHLAAVLFPWNPIYFMMLAPLVSTFCWSETGHFPFR